MKTENTSCIAVLNEAGKILLVKRKNITFHGWWCLPGGHAEKGERPEKAAQREASEEIGEVKVEKKPFMILAHDWPADSHTKEPHRHRCHAFMAKVCGKLRAADDAAELKWCTLDEADKMNIVDYTRIVLDKIKQLSYNRPQTP